MKLSVVILNYNVRYFLELCVKSVLAAIRDLDAEIIVVDNNSSDDSCAMVQQLFPEVNLIQNKNNLGFSKANNLAVKVAKGEYVCILNPDTVLAEDTFSTLLEFADKQSNLGVLGCQLIDGSGQFLPESKRNIPYIGTALKKLLGNDKDYYANHLKKDDIGKIQILVGAFMLMKQSVYKQVNGFDEDYFMYGEDIDLSYKAIKLGLDNYYFGKVKAIHFKGESTLKDKHYANRFFGAMQIFYKKHFKVNFVFDTLVWLGIRFAYLFRSKPNKVKEEIKAYVLISNKEPNQLRNSLKHPLILKTVVDKLKPCTELIFDADFLKYKQIISYMSEKERPKTITYKILPNASSFIIGSNQKSDQGEVINFLK